MAAVSTATAPVFSDSLDLASRKHAHDMLQAMAGRVPAEFAVQFQKILAVTTETSCHALCAAGSK